MRWSLPKFRVVPLIVVIAAAISSSAAFAQPAVDNDRCKAANSGQQAQTEQPTPAPDNNSSDRLKDCAGVLKPPVVGDSELEKPAPKVGRTPIIRPGDSQNGQRNDQQPDK
ncbi:hypothetical protein A6U86_17170 [Rhizobium sp. AC27/96]|uniref:hypothetical protein n=1 Tax=Rhizobium TaxID=379 RepID=UPI00082866AB|nr:MULTISPECIES: hypothetical protein [Rhizobium]OCI93799.1 hypothetical protein A6U86_17170 [Rhizobium sp. AC27/96]